MAVVNKCKSMDLEVAGKAAQSHTHYIYGYKFLPVFAPRGRGTKSKFRFKGPLDGHIINICTKSQLFNLYLF